MACLRLHVARAILNRRAGDASEGGRSQIERRERELGVVEGVEQIGAQRQLMLLERQAKRLEEAEVEVRGAVAIKRAAAWNEVKNFCAYL